MKWRILIVEDSSDDQRKLEETFPGHSVRCASTLEQARQVLLDDWPEIMVLDGVFPRDNVRRKTAEFLALELLKEHVETLCTSEHHRYPITILVSDKDDTADQFTAIQTWFRSHDVYHDFVPKALANREWRFFQEVLRSKIESLYAARALAPVAHAADRAFRDLKDHRIYTKCPEMQEVWSLIKSVASSSVSVLIFGENGTGKELVAQAIHDRSARRDMPFIKVDCGAIPEDLLESQLFGHERGAFTGATTKMKGRFALANGGTILLDEIANMTPATQVKFLRVLQEREFQPLGSERTELVDVRVIAATNADLQELMEHDAFREDLYYRLNVVPIQIPPLRDRGSDDVELLVEHFLKEFNSQQKPYRPVTLARDLLREFSRSQWPGNVRQLRNAIEAIVSACDGLVTWEFFEKRFPTHASKIKPGPATLARAARPGSAAFGADKLDEAIQQLKRDLEPQEWSALEGVRVIVDRESRPAPIHTYNVLLYLAKQGTDGASIPEIAKFIGRSQATVYAVFGLKDRSRLKSLVSHEGTRYWLTSRKRATETIAVESSSRDGD